MQSDCCNNPLRPSIFNVQKEWVLDDYGYDQNGESALVKFCPFCGQKPFIKENPDEKAFEAGYLETKSKCTNLAEQ